MTGIVNAKLEATLRLEILGTSGQSEEIVVIDTGYNGSLTLPRSIVTKLSLTAGAARTVILGDRSSKILNFYEAEIVWDGQKRMVPVLCVEGDPLVGTALLEGYKMEADFVMGGQVRLTAIP